MVSVGILAKDQRCVIPTNKTNFQGRKLSPKWEELTEKQKKFK